jgi:hypothetical protein
LHISLKKKQGVQSAPGSVTHERFDKGLPAWAVPAAPSRTFGSWTGFVDHQGTAEEILAVEGTYGALSFVMTGDFNEAKAAGFPRKAVANEGDFFNPEPGLTKPLLQVALGGPKGQVAHVKLFHHYDPL